jgi:hypothetical protein
MEITIGIYEVNIPAPKGICIIHLTKRLGYIFHFQSRGYWHFYTR